MKIKNNETIANGSMSLDEWVEKFKPIARDGEILMPTEDGEIEMFETYGEDLNFVRSQPSKKIWTYLDCDGCGWIQNGLHFVNRIGYYITENPWEEKDCIIIYLELPDDE